ncbi:hypothetical protein MJ391_01525 [Escherichia coli]|nr:hypothetical protein MJ391_01525 [Escherichia coli]
MTDSTLYTDVERHHVIRDLGVERQLSPITPFLNYQRQLEAIINFALADETGLGKAGSNVM